MIHEYGRGGEPASDAFAEIAALKRKVQQLRSENEALAFELGLMRQQASLSGTAQVTADDNSADRAAALRYLVMAAEYKDHDTGAHLVRIGYFSARLAPVCGCDDEFSRLMLIASTMHDVGKIGIPDRILKKHGALDGDERSIMQRHAEFGAKLLSGSDSPMLRLAAEIALSHHEHFDGTGYPRGLKGGDIPLSGRIVAVTDVFDALVMDRAYRPAMPVPQALNLIRVGRGSHFDPQVVDAFFSVADEILDMCERIHDDEPPSGLEWLPSEPNWDPFAFYDRPLRSLPATDIEPGKLQ
jgi:putative two-component system response regulator